MVFDVAQTVGVRPDGSAIVKKRDLGPRDVITGELGICDGSRTARGQRGSIDAMERLW